MGEHEAFIHELLQQLTATIQHLESHQIHMFYEAVGLMVGAEHLEPKRNEYLVRSQARVRLLVALEVQPDCLWPDLSLSSVWWRCCWHFVCGSVLRCSGFCLWFLQRSVATARAVQSPLK